MFTIRDALELPVFGEASVVAGQSGIDNIISRVHIITMPDYNWYQWTKGGELVLTVGFGLRANEDKQQRIIQSLVDHKIIGLVLSIGHYFEETPDILIREANRLEFPIIEVPGNLPFVEITEAIFTRIVNEQYSLLQRAQAIHKSLMSVVLNGGTLQHLVESLAQLLDKSITIESSSFRVLASSQQGVIDEARKRTLEAGQTTLDVINYLQDTGLHRTLLRDKQPIRIPPQPDYGLHIERIVAPILVAQSLLGYMWIIANRDGLTDLDILAVEQAATVAALLLYKEKAVQESKRAMRGDFFSQLLNVKESSLPQLESQADIFGFRLNRNYQVIVIENQEAAPSNIANSVESFLLEDTPALVTIRGSRVVVVLQTRQQSNGKRIARLLHDQLSLTRGNYLVGIGTETKSLEDIATSYEQAQEAITIAISTKQTEGIFAFDELGLLHWIIQLSDEALQANIFYRAICELDEHDSQLCETLEAFLDFGGSMKDAADTLYIHRNTLAYRLDRIEEIIHLDIRETQNKINLYVALKTYRLHQNSI